MKLDFDISELKRQAAAIYESEYMPVYIIGGSVLLVGLTDDTLWLILGLFGFAWYLFKRR